MPAPRKYPAELRDRAIRLVEDLRVDPDLQLSVTGACSRVSDQLGINRDTLRGWVKQAQIDAGTQPGPSTGDRRRLVDLERENRELRRGKRDLEDGVGFRRGGARQEHGCQIVPGTCYASVKRQPGARVVRDEELVVVIRRVAGREVVPRLRRTTTSPTPWRPRPPQPPPDQLAAHPGTRTATPPVPRVGLRAASRSRSGADLASGRPHGRADHLAADKDEPEPAAATPLAGVATTSTR